MAGTLHSGKFRMEVNGASRKWIGMQPYHHEIFSWHIIDRLDAMRCSWRKTKARIIVGMTHHKHRMCAG